MFLKKTLVWLFLGTFVPMFFPVLVSAYEIGTHAYLTNESFDLFNKNFSSQKISPELRDFLVDGARREDDVPRWMNHFYDPVNERGLTSDIAVDPINIGNWDASKVWAKDTENQNGLMYKIPATIASMLNAVQKRKINTISDETDFTWQEAIRYYANRENEKAMFALGHVLHLIQDASVPDHTRNDPHTGDSPYENFTSQYTLTSMDKDLTQRLNNKSIPTFSSLESYFKELATYSNNNFYSKDTIGIQSGYKSPEPEYVDRDGFYYYGFNKDENNKPIHLMAYINFEKFNYIHSNKENLTLKEAVGKSNVLDDYWSRLSTKSVLHSAGVVKLFFDEAEKAKNDPNFAKTKEKSFIAALVEGIGKIADTINQTTNDVRTFISEITNTDNGKNTTENQKNIFEPDFGDENYEPVIESKIVEHNIKNNEDQADIAVEEFVPPIVLKVETQSSTTLPLVATTTEEKNNNTQETSKDSTISTRTTENKTTSSGGGVTSASRPAPKFYDVNINEIMYDVEGSDEGMEWVEVVNMSTTTLDISEWKFFENNTNHRLVWYKGPKTVPQNGYAIIAGNAEKFIVAHPYISQPIFDSTFSLSNDGEIIAIKNDDLEIDSIRYDPSLGAHGDGDSLQKKIDGTWYVSVPTPGFENRIEIQTENQLPRAVFSFAPASPKVAESVLFDAVSSTDSDGTIILYEWKFGDEIIASSTNATTTHAYTQSGTYTAELTITDNSGGKALATTSLSIFPSEEHISPADHIVVSEILFNAAGSDEGKEFIELHNPTTSTIDVDGWAIKYRVHESTSTVSVISFNAGAGDRTQIPAQGFLLVGLYSYDSANFNGKEADAIRSRSLPNGTDEIILTLYDGSDIKIDEVSYSSQLFMGDGQSIERKTVSENACVSPQESGEFLGNTCDRDSTSDFESRSTPHPQNTLSLKEPRGQFSSVLPRDGATSTVSFNRDSLRLEFAWALSTSSDTVGDPIYRIVDVSSSTTKLATIETTSTEVSIAISEVGREYIFEMTARDSDGYYSEVKTYSTNAKSFLDGFYMYKDLRAGSENKYLLDLYYDRFPFIPNKFGRNAWQAMVFYLNRLPNKENTVLTNSNAAPHPPQDLSGVLAIVYSSCGGGGEENSVYSLPFPLSSEWCGAVGGGLQTSALTYASLEDKHLLIHLALPADQLNFSLNDYVTVGYYDLSDTGGGRQDFTFVAADETKNYFQNTKPSQKSPVIAGEITKSFNEASSLLTLSWNGATDEDTLDSKVVYDLSFTTSTDAGEIWTATSSSPTYQKHVASGDDFIISLRARDDFGNISEVATTSWKYPDVEWYITQEGTGGWSGEFGTVNLNSFEPDTATFQSITPQENISVNKIAVRVMQEQVSDTTDLRIGVYPDTGSSTPNMSVMLGEAVIQNMIRTNENADQTFTFSSPITLSAGTKYWLVLDVAQYGDSRGYFRNKWKQVWGNGYTFGDAGMGHARGLNTDPAGGLSGISSGSDWYMKIGLK